MHLLLCRVFIVLEGMGYHDEQDTQALNSFTAAVRCGLLSQGSHVAPSPQRCILCKRHETELTDCPIYGFKPSVFSTRGLTPALFCDPNLISPLFHHWFSPYPCSFVAVSPFNFVTLLLFLLPADDRDNRDFSVIPCRLRCIFMSRNRLFFIEGSGEIRNTFRLQIVEGEIEIQFRV